MTGKKWTDKEIRILLKNYGKIPMEELTKKLGKSAKACSIKFWRTQDFNDYIHATEVAKILHVDIKTVTGVYMKKELPYIRVRREILINFDDFVDWLKSHQNLWDSKKLDILALGYEYPWLKKKREEDKKKTFAHTRWREYEVITLCIMIEQGKSYDEISKRLCRSEMSIRHKWKRLNRKEK